MRRINVCQPCDFQFISSMLGGYMMLPLACCNTSVRQARRVSHRTKRHLAKR